MARPGLQERSDEDETSPAAAAAARPRDESEEQVRLQSTPPASHTVATDTIVSIEGEAATPAKSTSAAAAAVDLSSVANTSRQQQKHADYNRTKQKNKIISRNSRTSQRQNNNHNENNGMQGIQSTNSNVTTTTGRDVTSQDIANITSVQQARELLHRLEEQERQLRQQQIKQGTKTDPIMYGERSRLASHHTNDDNDSGYIDEDDDDSMDMRPGAHAVSGSGVHHFRGGNINDDNNTFNNNGTVLDSLLNDGHTVLTNTTVSTTSHDASSNPSNNNANNNINIGMPVADAVLVDDMEDMVRRLTEQLQRVVSAEQVVPIPEGAQQTNDSNRDTELLRAMNEHSGDVPYDLERQRLQEQDKKDELLRKKQEQAKKKRIWLIVAIVALLLIAGGAAAAVVLTKSDSSDESDDSPATLTGQDPSNTADFTNTTESTYSPSYIGTFDLDEPLTETPTAAIMVPTASPTLYPTSPPVVGPTPDPTPGPTKDPTPAPSPQPTPVPPTNPPIDDSTNVVTVQQLGNGIPGVNANDEFGFDTAMSADGKRIVVGMFNDNGGETSGHVKVFDWTGSDWNQAGDEIKSSLTSYYFGKVVAMNRDGTRLAAGYYADGGRMNSPGHVDIYEWTGSNWNMMGSTIDGEGDGDGFGFSIYFSADGNRVIIGAIWNSGQSGAESGHARVYEWTGSDWSQIGSDIDGRAAGDRLGFSVAMSSDGNRIAVSAAAGDGATITDAGYVQVFDWENGEWTQVGSTLEGGATGDKFGQSLDLSSDGTWMAVGARLYSGSGGEDSGLARVYTWNGSDWDQKGDNLEGSVTSAASGFSLAMDLSGEKVVVGANGENGGMGSARLFGWTGSKWNQIGFTVFGEAAGDSFGFSVSISGDGDRICVGATKNDSNGDSSGQVRVFSFS